MKLVSWNVNGLRAIVKKDFYTDIAALDADIICLQETKMQKGQCDIHLEGYEQYYNSADRKGYSGTAVFSRVPFLSVSYGIGVDEHDHEGRVITCETENFYLVCCYTPNAQAELKRLDYRMQWEDAFREYLSKLGAENAEEKRKAVLLCGDLNVAFTERDLARPDANHNSAGFSDQERGKFGELLASGFADTFRILHPEEIRYSWWSYRMNARARNVGWRIDYFLISDYARAWVKTAEIHDAILGSDHCPISVEIDA